MSTCCLLCRKTGCHSNCACGSVFLPLFKTYLETIGINSEGPFEDFHCCQNCGTQLGKIVATLNKLRIELLQMHSVTLENLDATVGLIGQEDDILDKLRRQIVAQPDPFSALCKVSIVEGPRPVEQIRDNQTQSEVGDQHVEEKADLVKKEFEHVKQEFDHEDEEFDHVEVVDSASTTIQQYEQVEMQPGIIMECEEGDFKCELGDESEVDPDEIISPLMNEEQGHPPLQLYIGDNNPDEEEESSPAPKRPRRIKSKEKEPPQVEFELKLPCRNRDSGCNGVFPAAEMKLHLENCYYREITCAYRTNQVCVSTKVPMSEYAKHVQVRHDSFSSEDSQWTFKLKNDEKSFDKAGFSCSPAILEKDGHTFFLMVQICSDAVYFWATVLAGTDTAQKYSFEFHVYRKKEGWKKKGNALWTIPVMAFHDRPKYVEGASSYVRILPAMAKEFNVREENNSPIRIYTSCRVFLNEVLTT